MLLFRSEEHVDRWCRTWNQPRGEAFELERQWELSRRWYAHRLERIRRQSSDEAQAILRDLGFTSAFWSYT
jgi:hypothetical protein